eukprot:g4743.t1
MSETLYTKCWEDFLHSRRALALRRAQAGLAQLASLSSAVDRVEGGAAADAEQLVTEADFCYIAGACRANDQALLERAVARYRRHLVLQPDNSNALRMQAESLLRLRRYEEACAVFDQIHGARLAGVRERLRRWEGEAAVRAPAALEPFAAEVGGLEVAPFRLLHDAALLEHVLSDGGPASDDAASGLGEALTAEERGQWLAAAQVLRDLVPRIRAVAAERGPAPGSGSGSPPSPPPRGPPASAARAAPPAPAAPPLGPGPRTETPVLRARDWAAAEQAYARDRRVTLDGLLSDAALAEVQRYAKCTPAFRTMRGGFLGAFPADGATHPLLVKLARGLERAMPAVFGPHPLGLWWLFKYPPPADGAGVGGEGAGGGGSGGGSGDKARGIGIHADDAAVNVNIWLTPDSARLSGGGLRIFHHVPPLGTSVAQVNHEFDSAADEAVLHSELERGGHAHIPYACNRAAIFVSDQYHVSEPFEFRPGYENHRLNLTFLFGDRAGVAAAAGAAAGAGAGAGTGAGADAGADGSANEVQTASDALFGASSSSSDSE